MNGEPTSSKLTTQGKWLRFALVGFPVGLVLLGAASFWIYFEKKEREEKRTYRHALALRRDISTEDIARYLGIIGESASLTADERRQTIASFVESTIGSENMGYDLKKDVQADRGVDRVSLRVALDGTRRQSDVVLVVAGYGDAKSADDSALAVLFSLAHAMTGTPRIKTVQFVVLDASVGTMQPAFDRLEYDMRKRGDRIVHLVALGASARGVADEWSRKPGSGSVTANPLLSKNADELKGEASALQKVITDAADRL